MSEFKVYKIKILNQFINKFLKKANLKMSESSSFIGREWLFDYIYKNQIKPIKANTFNSVLLITGDSGSGKTSICKQLDARLTIQGSQVLSSIRNRVLMVDYFDSGLNKSHNLVDYFKLRLNKCLLDMFSTNGGVRESNSDTLFETLSSLRNHSFKYNYTIVLDAIEHVCRNDKSNELVSFLNKLSASLPQRIKLILTCETSYYENSLSKVIYNHTRVSLNKKFSKFSKQCYDPLFIDVLELISAKTKLDKSAVLKQYGRLISRSNCNFLFISKILDLVSMNVFQASQLDFLPNKLNDLYIYLISLASQKLKRDETSDFDLVKLLLNLFLVNQNKPMSKSQLYHIVKSKHFNLSLELFNDFFRFFSNLFLVHIEQQLSASQSSISDISTYESVSFNYKLFNPNFENWLLSSIYYDSNAAYESMASYYWNQLCNYDCSMRRTSTPIRLDIEFIDELEQSQIERSYHDAKPNMRHTNHLSLLNKFSFCLFKCSSVNVKPELVESMKRNLEKHLSHADLSELNDSSSSIASDFTSASSSSEFSELEDSSELNVFNNPIYFELSPFSRSVSELSQINYSIQRTYTKNVNSSVSSNSSNVKKKSRSSRFLKCIQNFFCFFCK
jgi:archaellum biogenesis ATPase FlaH